MRRRIHGFTGGGRRRRLVRIALAGSVAALGVFVLTNALAVNDLGVFQLDGNAKQNEPSNPAALDDWDNVCHQATGYEGTAFGCGTVGNTSKSAAGEATAVEWSNDCNFSEKTCKPKDPTGTSDNAASIFQGGGSKDGSNINEWAWKDEVGGLPDKDNLVHSYAATYRVTNEEGSCKGFTKCKVLYFGLDRFDNSGDAQTGFWFLQNPCKEGTNKVGGATGFECSDPTPGTNPSDDFHRTGDLLVVSDFSVGGTTATINVYEWNPACTKAGQVVGGHTCEEANLLFLKGSGNALCRPAVKGEPFCGITNTSTITMPWSFKDKSNTPNNQALTGEFYEAGINLSSLGLGGECFATVQSETRSSTSTTAQLKDFIIAPFGKCESKVKTTAAGSTENKNIEGGTVSSGKDTAELTVTGAEEWKGKLNFYLCGPIAAGSTCDNTGVKVTSTAVSSTENKTSYESGTASLTSVGHYCWFGEFVSETSGVPNASDNGAAECFDVAPVTPILTTAASCTKLNGTSCVLGIDTLKDTAKLEKTANKPGTNGGSKPGMTESKYESINATNGAKADNKITWVLYGPGGTGAKPGCELSKTLKTPPGSTETVNGDGTYGPVEYKPAVTDGVGTYTFVASYPGDGTGSNTSAATPTTCPDTTGTETITVTGKATISSKQRWLPNDRVVVESNGGALNGELEVTLYPSSDCTGTAVNGQTYKTTLQEASSPFVFQTKNTDPATPPNTTFYVGTNPDGTAGGAAGAYSWKVHYKDSNLENPTDECETSTVSPITDKGATGPTGPTGP